MGCQSESRKLREVGLTTPFRGNFLASIGFELPVVTEMRAFEGLAQNGMRMR